MIFAYPWMLLAPFAIVAIIFLRMEKSAAVPYGSAQVLKAIPRGWRATFRTPMLSTLASLFVVLLSIAAARPQQKEVLPQRYEARNIMLSIDLSGSMRTADIPYGFGAISRMEAVKSVVEEFVQNRQKDRIGLVVFGSNAFLQAPLTLDHELVSALVQRLQAGLAGEGTAIGDGLGLSLKRMQDIKSGSRAVILLTDGVSNSGQVKPLTAAQVAQDLGIRVHTIGIGQRNAGRGNRGGDPRAEYDEETLRKIAEKTGGVFFNAETIEGLKKVYEEIDQLETTGEDVPDKEVVEELFAPYALASLLCFVACVLLAQTAFLKVP